MIDLFFVFQVFQAMSKNYAKVSLAMTLNEAIKCFHYNQRNCVLVVDDGDFLDGILTYGDVRRYLSKMPGYVSNTRFLDVCGDEHKISWLSGLCMYFNQYNTYLGPSFFLYND